VDETQAALPIADAPVEATDSAPAPSLPRWRALIEVILVCGIPTQVVLTLVLLFGFHLPILDGANISFEFFAVLSLVDTALIAVLIRIFLSLSGETSAGVFLGPKPVAGEVLRGLALMPLTFLCVTGIVLALRTLLPWTHTVDRSPLEAFMRTPLEAGIFAFVVVLAGGVREELQRAFILHRFDQRLGGIKVGLAVFSLTFGALHLDQGVDVAVAIGSLGLLWGVLYITRRSAIMAMTNHASFNAAQVLQAVLARSFGV
jgi:membrane protease YdiL (CAAX protease family)